MSGVEIDVQSNASVTNRELQQINDSLLRIAAYAKQTTDALNSAFRTGQFNTTSRSVDKVTASMKNLDTTSSTAFKGIDKDAIRAGRSIDRLTNGIGILLKSAAAIGAVSFGLKASDELTAIDSKLRTVTYSLREFQIAQHGVRQTSRDTNTTLADTADTYRALSRALQNTGASQKEILSLTKTLNQAAIVSGEAAESINSARIQLMQGLSSGVLRGEEFNSVTEQWSRLASTIAKYAGVSVGQLRLMANDGKITSQMVVAAIKADADDIAAEYDKVSIRIDVAMRRFVESLKQAFGKLSQSTGVTQLFTRGLILMSDGLNSLSANTGPMLDKIGDDFLSFFNSLKKHGTTFAAFKTLFGGESLKGFYNHFMSVHEADLAIAQITANFKAFSAFLHKFSEQHIPKISLQFDSGSLNKFIFDISRSILFVTSALMSFAGFIKSAFTPAFAPLFRMPHLLDSVFSSVNDVVQAGVKPIAKAALQLRTVLDDALGGYFVTSFTIRRNFEELFHAESLDGFANKLREISFNMRSLSLGVLSPIDTVKEQLKSVGNSVVDTFSEVFHWVTLTSSKSENKLHTNFAILRDAASVLGYAVKAFYTEVLAPVGADVMAKVGAPVLAMYAHLTGMLSDLASYSLSDAFALGNSVGQSVVRGLRKAIEWVHSTFAAGLTIPVAIDFATSAISGAVKLLSEGLAFVAGSFQGALDEAVRPTSGWFSRMSRGFGDMLHSFSDAVTGVLETLKFKTPKGLFAGVVDGAKDMLLGIRTPIDTAKKMLHFKIDYKAGLDFSALFKAVSAAAAKVHSYIASMWSSMEDKSPLARVRRLLDSTSDTFRDFLSGLHLKIGKMKFSVLTSSQTLAEDMGRFAIKALIQLGAIVVNSVKSLIDQITSVSYGGFAKAFDLIVHFLHGAMMQVTTEMSRGVISLIGILPDSAQQATAGVKARLKKFVLFDDILPASVKSSLNIGIGDLFDDMLDKIKDGMKRVGKALHGDVDSMHVVSYHLKVTAVAVKDSLVKALKSVGTGAKSLTLNLAVKLNLSDSKQTKLKDMFDSLATSAAKFGEVLQAGFSKAYELFAALIAGILVEASKLSDIYDSKIKPFINNVIDGFYMAWDEVVGHCSWPDLVKGVDSWADKFVGVGSKVSSFTSHVVDLFKTALTAVRGYLSHRFDMIVNLDASGFKNFFLTIKDNMLAALVAGIASFAGMPFAGLLKTAAIFGVLKGPIVDMGASAMVELSGVLGAGFEKLANNLAYMFKVLLASAIKIIPNAMMSFLDGFFGANGKLTSLFGILGQGGGIMFMTTLGATILSAKSKFFKVFFGGIFGPLKAMITAATPGFVNFLVGSQLGSAILARLQAARTSPKLGVTNKASATLAAMSLSAGLLPGISWTAAGAAALPFFLNGFKIGEEIKADMAKNTAKAFKAIINGLKALLATNLMQNGLINEWRNIVASIQSLWATTCTFIVNMAMAIGPKITKSMASSLSFISKYKYAILGIGLLLVATFASAADNTGAAFARQVDGINSSSKAIEKHNEGLLTYIKIAAAVVAAGTIGGAIYGGVRAKRGLDARRAAGGTVPMTFRAIGAEAVAGWSAAWANIKGSAATMWSPESRAKMAASWGKMANIGVNALKSVGKTGASVVGGLVTMLTGGLLTGVGAIGTGLVVGTGLLGVYMFGPEGTFMEKLVWFKDQILDTFGFIQKVWDPRRKEFIEAAPLQSFDGKDMRLSNVMALKDPGKMPEQDRALTLKGLSDTDAKLQELEGKRRLNGALTADEQKQADGLLADRRRLIEKIPNRAGADASAVFGDKMKEHLDWLQMTPDEAYDAAKFSYTYDNPDQKYRPWWHLWDNAKVAANNIGNSVGAEKAGVSASLAASKRGPHAGATNFLVDQWKGLKDGYDQDAFSQYLKPEEQDKYQVLLAAYADRLQSYTGGFSLDNTKQSKEPKSFTQTALNLGRHVAASFFPETIADRIRPAQETNIVPTAGDYNAMGVEANKQGVQLQNYIKQLTPVVNYRQRVAWFNEREAVDQKTAADAGANYNAMTADDLNKLVLPAANQRFLKGYLDGSMGDQIGDKASNKFQKLAATIQAEANEAYAKGIQEAADSRKHWKTDIEFTVKVGGLDVAAEDMNNFYAQSNERYQELRKAAEAYNEAVSQRDNMSRPGSWKKAANGDYVQVTQAEYNKMAVAAQAKVDAAKKQVDDLSKNINPLATLQKDMQAIGVNGGFQASFGVDTFNRVRGLVSYITKLRQDISKIATGAGSWADKMGKIAILSAQASAATQAINEAIYQRSATATKVQLDAGVDTPAYMSQDKSTRNTIEMLSGRLHELQLKEQAFKQEPGTALGEPFGVKTTTPEGIEVSPMTRPSEGEMNTLMKEKLAIQERLGEISKTYSNPLDRAFANISLSGLSISPAQYQALPSDKQTDVRKLSISLNEARVKARTTGNARDARAYYTGLESANSLVDLFVKRLDNGLDSVVSRINDAGGTNITAQQYMVMPNSVKSDLLAKADKQADWKRVANEPGLSPSTKADAFKVAEALSDTIKAIAEQFTTIEDKLSAFAEAVPDVDVNELKKGPKDQYDLALRIGEGVRNLHRTSDKIVDPRKREDALQSGLDFSRNIWQSENSRPDKWLKASGVSMDNETLVKYFNDASMKSTIDPALKQLAALKVQAATDPAAAAVYNLAVDKFSEAMKKAQESDAGLKMKAAGESFATDICSAINDGVIGVFSGKKIQDIWKSLKDTFVSSVNKTVIGGFMDGLTGPEGILTKQLKSLGSSLWKDGNDAAKTAGIDTPQNTFKIAVTEFGAWVQKLSMSVGLPGSGAAAATGLSDPYSLSNGTYSGPGLRAKTVLGMTADNPLGEVSIPSDFNSWATMNSTTRAGMYSLGTSIPNIDNANLPSSNYSLGSSLTSGLSSAYSPYSLSSMPSTDVADVSKIGFSNVEQGLSTNADTITANASNNTSALSSVFNSGWIGLGAKLAMLGGATGGSATSMWIGAALQAASIWAGTKTPTVTKADGGWVSGPGTGTSDSINARLSNGEYVVRAKQALKFRSVLDAINSGNTPAFATGGLVSLDQPALVSGQAVTAVNNSVGGSTQIFNIHVTGDVSRQTRSEIQAMIPNIAQGVNVYNHEKGNR